MMAMSAPFYALRFLAVYSHWAISIYFMFVRHVVFSCILVFVFVFARTCSGFGSVAGGRCSFHVPYLSYPSIPVPFSRGRTDA